MQECGGVKIPKFEKETLERDELINSTTTLLRGKLLPHPLSHKFWIHEFTGIPDFRFSDIYHYLVGKDGYDEDCLLSYKSRIKVLRVDGHVKDLKYYDIIDDGHDGDR